MVLSWIPLIDIIVEYVLCIILCAYERKVSAYIHRIRFVCWVSVLSQSSVTVHFNSAVSIGGTSFSHTRWCLSYDRSASNSYWFREERQCVLLETYSSLSDSSGFKSKIVDSANTCESFRSSVSRKAFINQLNMFGKIVHLKIIEWILIQIDYKKA